MRHFATMASGSQHEPPPPAGIDQVAVVGALAEPTRRALYEQVVDAGDWVSRDQAADLAGVPRATAAHHLDRLVDVGLLEVTYRRLSERRGPGAGRPAKLYRRALRDVVVTLPPRDYELAGALLSRAVETATRERTDVFRAVLAEAAAEGRSFAEQMRERCDGDGAADEDGRREVLVRFLAEHGYEPAPEADGAVLMRNCPFHVLSQQHRELVCRMNAELLSSAVDGFGGTGLHALLQPRPGYCCVALRPGAEPATAGAG